MAETLDLLLDPQLLLFHAHERALIGHRPVQLLVDEVLEMSVLVAQDVDVLLNGHGFETLPKAIRPT